MKNLYSKNEFLTLHKEGEMINENWIGKMFKGLYASIVKYSKNIKGHKEIDKVYDDYIKQINVAFSKFGNIGTAEATNTAIKNTNVVKPAATGSTPRVVDNINISYSQKLLEADVAQVDTGQTATLANLTPQKLEEISKMTKNRIEELKKELETAINTIVSNLSKKPDYSSDKLAKYATLKKNEFNSYIYNQWYGVYQKTGDQEKLKTIIQAKKQAEDALKKSIDEISSGISETQLEIKSGVTYKYDSKAENKEIDVKVVGRAVGRNQDNKKTTNPDHTTMWKVSKLVDGAEITPDPVRFWVAPSTLKAIPPTT